MNNPEAPEVDEEVTFYAPGGLKYHFIPSFENLLLRRKYTGIPARIRARPIMASRGRVIIVLKNSAIQNNTKIAGTTG
jgi:hypothetical protein